jgi:hypothetical protein
MAEADETRAEPLPPHETTASPVAVSVATPQYFGLSPATLLFGLTTATVAVAVVLALVRHWVAAIVLAAVGLVEVALFVLVAERTPRGRLARASGVLFVRARDRAAWLVESTALRSDAARRLRAAHAELLRLAEARERHLRALGLAVHEADDERAATLRTELDRVDAETRLVQERMHAIGELAQERLRAGRLRVQPTAVRPSDQAE